MSKNSQGVVDSLSLLICPLKKRLGSELRCILFYNTKNSFHSPSDNNVDDSSASRHLFCIANFAASCLRSTSQPRVLKIARRVFLHVSNRNSSSMVLIDWEFTSQYSCCLAVPTNVARCPFFVFLGMSSKHYLLKSAKI